MPKEYLPLQVDPFRFADNAIRLYGNLPIKNMQRLCASLYSNEGDVEITIAFGVDEQKIRFLRGHLETHLILQCQRCMGSFSYKISNDFASGLVETEKEADELPKRYDAVVVKGGILLIQDVIEDELIIEIPLVPMHDAKDCKITLPLATDLSGTLETEKESPFKVIESLRSKRDAK